MAKPVLPKFVSGGIITAAEMNSIVEYVEGLSVEAQQKAEQSAPSLLALASVGAIASVSSKPFLRRRLLRFWRG